MKTNIKIILFLIAAVTADYGYAQELKLNMDSALTISLGTKPLLTYQFKTVYPPPGIDTNYKRSGFIHLKKQLLL